MSNQRNAFALIIHHVLKPSIINPSLVSGTQREWWFTPHYPGPQPACIIKISLYLLYGGFRTTRCARLFILVRTQILSWYSPESFSEPNTKFTWKKCQQPQRRMSWKVEIVNFQPKLRFTIYGSLQIGIGSPNKVLVELKKFSRQRNSFVHIVFTITAAGKNSVAFLAVQLRSRRFSGV